jgi:hypothetical protein
LYIYILLGTNQKNHTEFLSKSEKKNHRNIKITMFK